MKPRWMKRLSERIAKTTGWKRFALRQTLKLWRVLISIFATTVVLSLLTPCFLLYAILILKDTSLLFEALIVGGLAFTIGVLGLIFAGLIEEIFWPTWF